MIILFISHLTTNIAAGMSWSVPACADAQSLIDNVLWVNATNGSMDHWQRVGCYHPISEFGGKLKLECLPNPFNSPDFVVIEGFYYLEDWRLSVGLRKKRIPYIIVPRGSLTKQALHNHAWLKKWIAHRLFFDSYIKNAAAIQFLTRQEADDSIERYNTTPYFIVPNGFNTPEKVKESFSSNGIKASFIGRLDMYHKGIDLLLEAISLVHEYLADANFHLMIYGPRRYDYYKIEEEIVKRNISDVVAIHNEVGGNEKKDVLLNSDLFVMTSRFEGHPMGLIEALSYGVPCMVTPGTNMAEEVFNADAGWCCEGSVLSIKDCLIEIVHNKSLLSTKGRNASLLSKNYQWSVLAKKFHVELERLNSICKNK